MKLNKIERYYQDGVMSRRYFTDSQYKWQGYGWSLRSTMEYYKMYWVNDVQVALRIVNKKHYHI
jgi:hypothetical protein